MHKSRVSGWLAGTVALAATAADAAPARPPLRQPARPAVARPAVARPAVPAAPPEPAATPGIMVPRPVVLIRPTPAEARAHAVWTLRAALNVAALQCQYSRFLRTVDQYNQMLKIHGAELAAAQRTMVGHFTRTLKTGGPSGFDRYNTRSYNSFSTLDAQYNFCWHAGQAGQDLRMAAVGDMAGVAQTHLPLLRAALRQVPVAAGLQVPVIALPRLPPPQLVDIAD